MIGAPAKGNGQSGWLGYITYTDVCWFKNNNVAVTTVYDVETCSPYLYAGEEWISYDNEKSLECKVSYKTQNTFCGYYFGYIVINFL